MEMSRIYRHLQVEKNGIRVCSWVEIEKKKNLN